MVFSKLAFALCGVGALFVAADVHPFNSQSTPMPAGTLERFSHRITPPKKDLVTFNKISGPAPSPSGSLTAFTVSLYNIDENLTNTTLRVLKSEDDSVVFLQGGHHVQSPFWIAEGIIGGLSSNSGSSQ
ncbi:hypothetical protein BDK51DRAFT_32185, partial [Blyttiomyces helicus]